MVEYSVICVQFFLLLLSVNQVISQANPCAAATDCGSCIRAGSSCHWCLETNFTFGENFQRLRCNFLSAFNGTCSDTTVDIKTSPIPTILANEPFGETVQVAPQHIEIKLRPGQPITFPISVQPAENFPVDIYFLMDVSFSMRDDIAKLQTLGNRIATEIQRITTRYRFAFGGFVDKPIAPYVQPSDATFPCSHESLRGIPCRPVFGFIHFFDFSNDTDGFEAVVAAQNSSGDADSPEGGFDGLMQVSVCENVFKWQEKRTARRIALFVTDNIPKIAGDAKLAGVVTPNDGKCHMESFVLNDTEKFYTESAFMDYPSIHQLKQAMLENEIVPILAVTNTRIRMYTAIQKEWQDLGAAIGELNDDSSNIVNLIRDNYEKISSTVRLTNSNLPNFNIKYEVKNCLNKTSSPNECIDVKKSEKVDFDVTVTALRCPTGNTRTSFPIRIPSFGEVIVNVTYLCDCSCESSSQENSPSCSTNGTFVCGICKCNEGRYGSRCQCDSVNTNNDTSTCIGADNRTCSDSGECVCGKCECFPEKLPGRTTSGTFCECKNYGCPNNECGNGQRGTCVCNKCQCKDKYFGEGCNNTDCNVVKILECTKDGVECSGRGTCNCVDKCDCRPETGYTGKYCDECLSGTCRCGDASKCALCALGRDDLNCSDCGVWFVRKIQERPLGACVEAFNSSCLVYFNVTAVGVTNPTIVAWETLECVAKTSSDDETIPIIIGIIAAILLLGLLALLLWKLLVTLHDRRDYEQFQKSQQNDSKWGKRGNPIYREPQQQFENPSFVGGN